MTIRDIVTLYTISLIAACASTAESSFLLYPARQVVHDAGFPSVLGPAQIEPARNPDAEAIAHLEQGAFFKRHFNGAQVYGQASFSREGPAFGDSIHFFEEHAVVASLDKPAVDAIFIESFRSSAWSGSDGGRAIMITTGVSRRHGDVNEKSLILAGLDQTEAAGRLSSAEWVTDDGRVAAYGEIQAVVEKQGRKFLTIDFGEWITEEECRRRVRAGSLDLDEADCEVDSLRYDNQNPTLREFAVADDVEILIAHPSRPAQIMAWHEFAELQHVRADDKRELWDGLWRIFRRGNTVERIEWIYTP